MEEHQAPANQHPAFLRHPNDSMNHHGGPRNQWQRNQWAGNQWSGNQRSGNQWSQGNIFECYMSAEKVSAGLQTTAGPGQLIQGPLRINPRRFTEAFVPSPDGTSRDIFLDGVIARNRALNGDVVALRLLPRNQWRVVRSSEGEETVQRTGRVVSIVERKHSRAATGHLALTTPNSPTVALFRPVDHRVPRITVPLADCPAGFARRPGDFADTLFVCRVTDWPADSLLAEGRLAGNALLGRTGEIRPETEGILAEYDVDSSEFPPDVLACLPSSSSCGPWAVPHEELSKRKDLRGECVFTIDPASATDLDDALSCKRLPDGNFQVGVHIADVAYFVEEGTALDSAAAQRATSVYMVQKMIPMLPRPLCEELCSLRPGADRLAFSVVWTLTQEGEVLGTWFGRSVIRSCVKLSYEHAQSVIEGGEELPQLDGAVAPPEHPADEIRRAVLDLHAIAKNLRARRFREGALRLDRLKLSFELQDEGLSNGGVATPTPLGCHVYAYRQSNELVEEFMLLANMAAATQIHGSFPELALLRRHPPPQDKMVAELGDFCEQMGLDVDFSSAGALHQSLGAIVGDDKYSAARKEVLTNMCSRIMQMAEYFCAGVQSDESRFRHYALNVPLYTHFTSPIRRYADVIVHRLLAASLGCGPPVSASAAEIQRRASHCNDKRAASKRAHELSTELFFGAFVRGHGGGPLLDSEAMVMGVLDHAFDVVVLRYGVQKRIYPRDVAGLHMFRHNRVGRKSELTLVWADLTSQKPSVCQVVSLFSIVEVTLRADGASVKCTLKRPAEDASYSHNAKDAIDNNGR